MGHIHGGRLVGHSRYPTILYYLQLANPSAARSRLKELAREEQPACGGNREVERGRRHEGSLQTSRLHRTPHDTQAATAAAAERGGTGRSLWRWRGSTTGQSAAS